MWGIGTGVVVAFLWIVLWTLVLRAFGIPVFPRSPEQHEIFRERFLRMGQTRYVLVEGILGFGVAIGLAIVIAGLLTGPSQGWIETVCKFVFLTVIIGSYYGFNGWVKLSGPAPSRVASRKVSALDRKGLPNDRSN